MNGELEEFDTIFLKKYGVSACIVDKHWGEGINEYLYCLELDKSITADPYELVLFSLTYDDIYKLMND